MAPSYANLFMGKFEQQAIDNSSLKPFIWWRFIDDIFMIWTHGEEHLKTFIGYLHRPFSKMAAENLNKSKLKTNSSTRKSILNLVTLSSFSISGEISAEKM